MTHKRNALLTGAGLALAMLGSPAHASLGAPHASVDTDRAAMHAQRHTTLHGQYQVEQLALGNGAYVQEYVNGNDAVFAISWHGRAMPKLRQLLGSYAERAATGIHAYHAAHGPLGGAVVSSADFMLQANGRMGSFFGRAWLPAQLPPGTDESAIQ